MSEDTLPEDVNPSFDNGDWGEFKVDGKRVLRVDFPPDISMSAIDDAAVVTMLRSFAEEIDEQIKEEHGQSAEEILREYKPRIEGRDSEDNEWESVVEEHGY